MKALVKYGFVYLSLASSLESNLADLILNLECGESLVVEDLASLPAIESEVSMAEVGEHDDASEEKHPRVVSLALLFEGVVTELVAEGLIVDLGVLLKGHGKSVT